MDESSIRKDGTGVETMSMYKLLVLLERTRNVTSWTDKITSTTAIRKDGSVSEPDTFILKVTQPKKYVNLHETDKADPADNDDDADDEEPPAKKSKKKSKPAKDIKDSASNIFGSFKIEECNNTVLIKKCFRFRFESVGQSLKLMKPYMVSEYPIPLRKGKPKEVFDFT